MTKNSTVLRDFLYVDIERLYSLYSQLFGGVTDRLYQSKRDVSGQVETQQGKPMSGRSNTQDVQEEMSSSESKVLLDHMYNKLETKIEPAILNAEDINMEDWVPQVHNAFMIKVKQ